MSLIGFILPADCGEKMTMRKTKLIIIDLSIYFLEISLVLGICLFQNSVSQIIPQTSESVSLLGWLIII